MMIKSPRGGDTPGVRRRVLARLFYEQNTVMEVSGFLSMLDCHESREAALAAESGA